MHTVYFVQGACNADWYGATGRYTGVAEQVAGPIVCTTSQRDAMLSKVFEPFHGTSAVFYTLWTMANAQTVLHKLKDVQRCADILRERLPRDSAHHERATDVGEVFGEYARDLQPQLQGASTMTTKQRNLIKKIARKADITYRLLRSLVGTKNLTYLQF